MIHHLRAMRALLEARGFTTWLMNMTATESDPVSYPYIVISPGYGRSGERPLGDRLASIDHDLQVRCVGATPESMLGLLGDVREVLSPGKGPLRLLVPGRRATLRFIRHEMSEVDRDVTITGTGTHPHFGVDAFHLVSTPIRLPEEG